VRIIATKALREWGEDYPDARIALQVWQDIVEAATWTNLMEVRRDLPSADGVVVDSGNVVTVFNIRGNHYRLLTAIHYNRQIVFVMRFLTHAEYDRNRWMETL